jgi:hypothetical protein
LLVVVHQQYDLNHEEATGQSRAEVIPPVSLPTDPESSHGPNESDGRKSESHDYRKATLDSDISHSSKIDRTRDHVDLMRGGDVEGGHGHIGIEAWGRG